MTWDVAWDDPTFAPVILAVAMPPSIVTAGGDVTTVSNGFYQDRDGIKYYQTTLSSMDGCGYQLLISQLR